MRLYPENPDPEWIVKSIVVLLVTNGLMLGILIAEMLS